MRGEPRAHASARPSAFTRARALWPLALSAAAALLFGCARLEDAQRAAPALEEPPATTAPMPSGAKMDDAKPDPGWAPEKKAFTKRTSRADNAMKPMERKPRPKPKKPSAPVTINAAPTPAKIMPRRAAEESRARAEAERRGAEESLKRTLVEEQKKEEEARARYRDAKKKKRRSKRGKKGKQNKQDKIALRNPYHTTIEVNFEDDDIEGALLKPEGALLSSSRAEADPAAPLDSEKDARDVDGEPVPIKVGLRLQSTAPGGLPADGRRPADPLAQLLSQPKPDTFLPRMFYFENTYLGGNAAYAERLRKLDEAFFRRPYRLARLPPQPLDPPTHAGLALTAQLNTRTLDHPQRVLLQVGLQGSERFGWRRPPLDITLLAYQVDAELLTRALTALMKRLDSRDRLALVCAGERFAALSDVGALRRQLIRRDLPTTGGGRGALAAGLAHVERILTRGGDEARIPGTQIALLMTGASRGDLIEPARAAAHDLNVRGVTTSVIHTRGSADWWPVAAAGHGNLHGAETQGGVDAAVEAELESLSKIIARLLRVNIRLAPHVEAIRVLGSRKLEEEEVKQVKAREVATDQNLSKTLGVTSDRGEDDDGVQTVIPYFYGGDTHLILVELWVDKPGPVADVTLKYKDMVQMSNATARAAVSLSARPLPERIFERQVAHNAADFLFAERLAEIGHRLKRDRRRHQARAALQALRGGRRGEDAQLVDGLLRALDEGEDLAQVGEMLLLSGERRIGE